MKLTINNSYRFYSFVSINFLPPPPQGFLIVIIFLLVLILMLYYLIKIF